MRGLNHWQRQKPRFAAQVNKAEFVQLATELAQSCIAMQHDTSARRASGSMSGVSIATEKRDSQALSGHEILPACPFWSVDSSDVLS
jgi:hypothetical protein